jgi:hypothetical protein
MRSLAYCLSLRACSGLEKMRNTYSDAGNCGNKQADQNAARDALADPRRWAA